MAITSGFSNPTSMAETNPANPNRSLRSANPVNDIFAAIRFGGNQQQQRPSTTFGGGSIGLGSGTGPFGSLGNTTNMFMRQQGPVRSQAEQMGRSSMMQNALAGGLGWSLTGNTGSGAPNPYSFDNAFRDAMSNQNAVQSLIGQSRQNLAPMLQQAQSAYATPQGLDPAALSAMNASNDMATARALSALQRDTANRLSASGFADSPAAAYIDSQTRGAATQSELDRRAALAMQDAEMRNANRQFAAQWLSQLLGLDAQSALQGAETIGRLQTPYLTPEAAAGMGYGGGAAAGGGMPQGQFSSAQNNNMGSSRYLEQLMMNQSPLPQQNPTGYQLGPNQSKPYNAPPWLAP